jgi:hypothetical protein
MGPAVSSFTTAESQNNYSDQSALLEKMTTPLPALHAGLLVMLVV